ncbi:MAG TPA: nuclear transport factor 2 family protein, partial [Burkholderiales bacterium]|nr:nuclear transport factor 2 family protein [Burkholderiales bacterium]
MSEGIPDALLDYVEGLKTHDIVRVAASVSDELEFLSAAKLLDKAEFLDMLRALYNGFPDWNYEYDRVEDLGDGNYAIK